MTADFPAEAIEKARMIIKLAENTEAIRVADVLAPWVRDDPEAAVRVMLTLALMADRDRFIKQGHAAYVRGERTPEVVAMEREYQRGRKRKYRAVSRARAEAEGPAA